MKVKRVRMLAARSAAPEAVRVTKPRRANGKARSRKNVAEINAWLALNHDQIVKQAEENCRRLTGKSRF